MKADGYSLDDKRQPIAQNDIPDVLEKWKTRSTSPVGEGREGASFFVPFEEIKQNNYDLSINRYKEVVHDEKKYDEPQVLIDAIETLDKERSKALQELKQLLAEV
jgi:type I restriction enzyme M protein